VWKPGFFHLDVEGLEKKLTKAKLVLGNVKETVTNFIENEKPAPIGFVSFDVDYYSSTVDFNFADFPLFMLFIEFFDSE
jgi:hypothetical protein